MTSFALLLFFQWNKLRQVVTCICSSS